MSGLKKIYTIVLLTVSFLIGVFSIILVKLDPKFHSVWLPFWLHITSFLLISVAFIVHIFNKKKVSSVLNEKEVLVFGGVFLIAIFLNFFQLTMYPYPSLGDEVRDSGLHAQQIAHGQIQNIFAYGDYDGYGLIIPTIASLFYTFLGNSVLTYRFPAALVSVLDIVFLYILLRQFINRYSSALGAGILAVLPLHLFFARTQLVVAFNAIWTTLMLLLTYVVFETNSIASYILLGALMGFSSQFHATVRVIAILLFLLTVVCKTVALLRKKIALGTTILGLITLIVFAVVSFGPQMLYSNTQNFFHLGRFALQKNLETKKAPSSRQIMDIGHNYVESLGAWMNNSVGGDFFHDDQPLVPFYLIPLFLLGIFYAVIFLRKTFFYILFSLLFLIPFFSSAITDAVNSDQRMNSALPLVAIFCGIGIYVIFRFLRKNFLQWIFVGLVSVYIGFLGIHFFTNQTADIGREMHEYTGMNVIYAIQNQIGNDTSAYTYCLVASKNDWTNFDYEHYQDQHTYFLPNITLDKQVDTSLPDSTAYLYKGECDKSKKQPIVEEKIDCNGSLNFMCPKDWIGTIKLYSD